AAGVEVHVRPGERVARGQKVLTLHTDTPERFERAKAALAGGWAVGELDDAAARTLRERSVILDRIG
ncbi:thymidine phosphorylase, partial [Micrococcus luteus]|nr:thymidine phosphorylase [Micrococcus luteus]